MQLPAPARAALAAELIRSLDTEEEPEEAIEAAWRDEIRRRLDEIDSGAVTAIPWADAEQRILEAARRRGKAG